MNALRWTYPLLIALGALLLFLGNLLIWVDTSVLNSDNFAGAVHETLDKPEVQDRLATMMAQQAVDTGVIQEEVKNRLPTDAAFLEPVINSQLETVLAEAARRFLASDLTSNLGEDATRRLHARVLAVLTGDQTGIDIRNNAIVLDLSDIMDRIFERIGVTPPAALQRAAGNYGTVVILDDASGLDQASWLLTNRHAIIFGFVGGAVLCFVLAVLVARDKRRAVGTAGYAVLTLTIITLLAVFVSNWTLGQVEPERIVARELVRALQSNLLWQSLGLAVLGTCLVIASDSRTMSAIDGVEDKVRTRYYSVDPEKRRYVLPAMGGLLVLFLLIAN